MNHQTRSGIPVRLSSLALALCLCFALFIPVPSRAEESAEAFLVPDFTLTDQYGNIHSLSDYRGKAVFLNFWATWCPLCVKEMPDMEELYHKLGENTGDVAILGVAAPGVAHVGEKSQEEVVSFLEQNHITYPVLMDTEGELFGFYVTEGYPTTLFIRADGYLQFYVPGALDKESMADALRQTLDAAPPQKDV